MFTIHNKGKKKVEVKFYSAKTLAQVDETLVKAWDIEYGNKTTKIDMDWVPIEGGGRFDFNMKDLKHFECGNVRIRYKSYYIWTIEKDLQHTIGKGMVITSEGELAYCEMENPKGKNKVSSSVPQSSFCSVL